MNNQTTRPRYKKLKRFPGGKRVFALVVVSVVVGLSLFAYYSNLQYEVQEKSKTTQQVKYYDDAVKAWKGGDKKKAKELAREFLKQNDNMSQAEREKVPGQVNKVLNMLDMEDGQAPL